MHGCGLDDGMARARGALRRHSEASGGGRHATSPALPRADGDQELLQRARGASENRGSPDVSV